MCCSERSAETKVPQLRGVRTHGTLKGKIEMGPWKNNRKGSKAFNIEARDLHTYLGNFAEPVSIGDLWQTVFNTDNVAGEKMTKDDLARDLLFLAMGLIGKGLRQNLFTAKRNPSGDKTSELFNGFDSICDAEKLAGKIALSNKNMHQFDATITLENIIDKIDNFVGAASPELLDQPCKLCIDPKLARMYNRAYKLETGMAPYNDEYKRVFLDEFPNVEIVPFFGKEGSKHIQLTTKENMRVGFGTGIGEDSVDIKDYDPFFMTIFGSMYFGVDYLSLDPEMFFDGVLHEAA